MHLSLRATLLCVCAVLIVSSPPAFSQLVPKVDTVLEDGDGVVTVNSRTAVRFRVTNGNLTPLARAQITAKRIESLTDGGWRLVQAKSVGRNRADVVAGDKLICIATAADAKANGTSPLALAQSWAKQIRWLFSMPPISVSPTEMTVPESENRFAKVGGAATGPISVVDGNPAVATSTVDAARRSVAVYGKSVGRSTIDVICQGCRTQLVVNVKRYAGRIARTETVEITGNPAPDWLIEEAAAYGAPSSVALEPGATPSFGKPKLPVKSLQTGQFARVLVPTTVTGDGLIPTELLAPVDVVNRRIPHKSIAGLFYSNNPERLTRYGNLFTGKLALDERQRLLYHHQNMLGKRVRFLIELINSGSSPASVQTISGITPPMVDTVVVGYLAGLGFMRSYLADIGRVYKVPPRSRVAIYAEDLDDVKTASGIIDLRQLSGEDVFVRVIADVPSARQLATGETAPINDRDIPSELSDHNYSPPAKQVEAKYVVGQQWAFIRIGKHAIRGVNNGRELYGNYGVIYELKIRMENPSSETRKVKVVFEPTAGPASGLFLVGGKIEGIKIIVPPKEYEITSVMLGPGQSRDLTVTTIPLSGSAYPATVVVRS